MSDKNRLREWKIAPKRGIIYDYFGNIIADNTQVFQLHVIPENIVDMKVLFFRLKKIIELSDEKIVKNPSTDIFHKTLDYFEEKNQYYFL